MKNYYNKEPDFLCPECGHSTADLDICVSPLVFNPESNTDDKNPYASVMQLLVCDKCQREISVHLGERWSGISAKQAMQEWQENYRDYKLLKIGENYA